MSTQRLQAIILSIGGVGWGLFCLPFLFWNPSYALMIFGPGYFVTVGYILRAGCTLSLGARMAVWLLSSLVQGSWLIWATIGIAEGAWFRGGAFDYIPLVWWFFACIASVYGLFTEQNLKAPESGSCPDRL